MDAEHLSSLRQAATALISTAAAPAVLAALRALLADPEFAWEAPPRPPPSPTPHRAPAPAPRAAPPPRPAAAVAEQPVVDAAWEDLRAAVKAAMAERGVSITDVAAAIGRSEIAARISLGSRKPPRPIVQSRLQAWLADEPTDAPEVAAHVAATFRPNGAGRVHADSLGAAD
jgi:hypothetical protein